MTPSRLPQSSLTPVLRHPSRLNELAGRFSARGAEWQLRPTVNAGRETLGLPPWKARDYLAAVNQTPTVYGVSPALMPADPAWPAHVTVVGHLLRADPESVIPEGLPEFLAEHPGAVYVGFGSWGNAVRQSGLDTAFEFCDSVFRTADPLLKLARLLFGFPFGFQIPVVRNLSDFLLVGSLCFVEAALDLVFHAGFHISPWPL